MITTKVYNEPTVYKFVVTNGIDNNNIYEYCYGKELPEGQELTEYLQNCKHESELLAQHEINLKAPSIEIII